MYRVREQEEIKSEIVPKKATKSAKNPQIFSISALI